MPDFCAFCDRDHHADNLRMDADREPICRHCFDGDEDEWLEMETLADAAEAYWTAQDDRAHAIRDMRAGL